MFSNKLEQIDRDLIDLLARRISILAEQESQLETSSLDEQLTNVLPALAQTNVPKPLWQDLVNGCMAALAKPVLPLSNQKKRRVTIIGGRGLMGSFFTQWFLKLEHQVNILEHNEWDRADRLLKGVDLVLVCVPLDKMPQVIQKAAKYMDRTTALADVASIKTLVMQTMLEHHQGPVISLHPMFGGGIESFLAQKVAICPGRETGAFQWLLNLIERDGGKIVECSVKEHDHLMTLVQAIRHFVTFSLGVFLAEEEIDIDRSLEVASPPFRMEVNLVSRLFSSSAPLSVDIMLASPKRGQAITKLTQTYSQIAQLVVKGDRDALLQKFQAVRNVFARQNMCTLEESTHLIDSLSTLLAAQQMSANSKNTLVSTRHSSAVSFRNQEVINKLA